MTTEAPVKTNADTREVSTAASQPLVRSGVGETPQVNRLAAKKEAVTEQVYAEFGLSPGDEIPPSLTDKMQKEISRRLGLVLPKAPIPLPKEVANKDDGNKFVEFPNDETDPAAEPSPKWADKQTAYQKGKFD